MSGLSSTERVECAKILKLMSEGDLRSLSDTVTNKMIVVENMKEATETILSFTKNAEELLRRKKVHRDLIFKYLAAEGIPMPRNSEKQELVKRALELWSSGKNPNPNPKDTGDDSQQKPTKDTVSDSTNAKTEADFDPQVLGQEFCQWFFQLLNSQNPSLSQQPQDWGPQHFWPDVTLEILSRAGSEQREDFQGAELVSLRLLALTREERLLLSPNLDLEGLKVQSYQHGPVKVGVAGTIHRDKDCLGIFEQIFGLIRSPLENNSWKIKFIKLKILGQDALRGAKVAASALTYDSTELQLLSS
ncbi:hypothetical protein L3Q82_017379 [Scortum barcoo]|uniref:Uncharacterized protein n=1 Tax=Scortum barcoo TaxID=214431 RepID=A0ACB8VKR6_9TELE|nr:hypothetical protein L3Q82_017379 [Scortum barcoo]